MSDTELPDREKRRKYSIPDAAHARAAAYARSQNRHIGEVLTALIMTYIPEENTEPAPHSTADLFSSADL